MSEDSGEQDLLRAAKAVEQRLITPADLARAVAKWSNEKSANLLQSIEEESNLDDDTRNELRNLFATYADAPAADIAETMDDSFFNKLNDALGDVDHAALQATVTKWAKTDSSLPLPLVSENDRFRVMSEHARGGLGEVLVARDLQLNRQVALKRIRDKWASHDQAKIRFQLEAEITGRLEHPGVVPVYALGQKDDGEIYYAMRFIRGESLESAAEQYHEQRCDAPVSLQSADFRDLLSRFVDVCNTISYAHNRGIIHRDLKPANIMLGKFGETLVVDWGLAKQIGVEEDVLAGDGGESQIISELGSGSAPTQIGSAVGTPQFMSPEQATGRLDRMGPLTDVYGLGATLYFVLTGRPPLEHDPLPRLLERAEHGEFDRPTEAVPSVPPPLEAVCLKAMERVPSGRYESASALARDVSNAVAGQRVSAYHERGFARLKRWAMDHKLLAQILAMTVLVLIVGASAWSTAALLHQQSLLQQRVDSLVSQADLNERLLVENIEGLRQDILLLSRRPQLMSAALAFETVAVEHASADSEAAKNRFARELAQEFEAILGLHPGYMQVRLISADGFEKVRVDRSEPGGPTQQLPATALQDKGSKDYFRDTRDLNAGDVYLSEININMEQGQHQWQTPTIRAAAPVLGPDDERFLGTVVVNMHFGRITNSLVPRQDNGDLLVYLTDDQGRFLFSSDVAELAFSFERGLTFSIENLYREVGSFRASSTVVDLKRTETVPHPAVLITKPAANNTEISKLAGQLRAEVAYLNVRTSEYRRDDSGTGMLIVTSDEPTALHTAARHVTESSDTIQTRQLAKSATTNRHALCARKIFFDPAAPDRFLCLVLARPY